MRDYYQHFRCVHVQFYIQKNVSDNLAKLLVYNLSECLDLTVPLSCPVELFC